MALLPELNRRDSESDAEQKVIYPLLTSPTFLGIPEAQVKTKRYLKSSVLEQKTGLKSGYIPDYAVWIESLPVFVCEAKAPSVGVAVGYTEAAAYARHINTGGSYGHGINPCNFIMASNGVSLLYGYWDAAPEEEIQIKDLVSGSKELDRLLDFCGHAALLKHAQKEIAKLRFGRFVRPATLAGDDALLNSKLAPNTFAADLAPVLRRYFTSTNETPTPEIYRDAYITSTTLDGYDAVLDSLLKDKLSSEKNPLVKEATDPNTRAERLTDAISNYESDRPLEGELQLIVGHVGSGKSLYMRRYRELLVSADLQDKICWAFVDFNYSPPSLKDSKQAEEWLCENFVNSFGTENKQIDLDDEKTIHAIFSADISRNKAIYQQLSRVDEKAAELQRIKDLHELRGDPVKYAIALCRHFGSERRRLVVCVLDNVDKKDLDVQLDAFQLGLWFKATTRSFVVVQMRDETYERFKDTPPLDSYRTGVTFHISPPRFAAVVRRRLELSLDYLTKHTSSMLSYSLPNGMIVRYPNTRAGEFLKEIYIDLFVRRVNISRILQGIAGADVRKALEMFFSILISGFLSEDKITSHVAGAKTISIPDSLIIKILMRTDYRFFHDKSGFIKNLFTFDQEMARPNNFIMSCILYFLAANRKTRGEIGLEGYFSVPRICDEMTLMGFNPGDAFKACEWLLENELLTSDHMKSKGLDPTDSIRLSSSGFMHLRVLSERIEYITGILPSTPIFDRKFANRIADRVRIENERGWISGHMRGELAREFHAYLSEQAKEVTKVVGDFSTGHNGVTYILGQVARAVEYVTTRRPPVSAEPNELDY